MATYDYRYLDKILKEMADGDADATEAVFAATYRPVAKKIYARLGQKALVEDCMQNIYTRIFSGTIRYPQNGKSFIQFLDTRTERIISQAELQNPYIQRDSEAFYMKTKEAEVLYQYICTLAGIEASPIPMKTMESYNDFRKMRTKVLYAVAILAAIAVVLIPFLFIQPRLEVTQMIGEDEWSPEYMVEVVALLPVDSVTAYMDDEEVPIRVEGPRKYVLLPKHKGTITATAKLVSNASAETEIKVDHADGVDPVMEKNTYDPETDTLRVWLTDTDSGIDYENSYAEQPDGTRITPDVGQNAELIFRGLKHNANIYFYDNAGNLLHLLYNKT